MRSTRLVILRIRTLNPYLFSVSRSVILRIRFIVTYRCLTTPSTAAVSTFDNPAPFVSSETSS